jgi:hypothetical protein
MRRLTSTLAMVAAGVLAACSGGGSSTPATTTASGTVLAVADIPAAVRAVKATVTGPPRFTEINATPGGVNVFLATGDGKELAYVYADGRLQPPPGPTARTGTPFALDGVAVDAGPRLVDDVQRRFPGATVVAAAIVALADQGVSWAFKSRSPRGGVLDVVYSPTGALRSVTPAS